MKDCAARADKLAKAHGWRSDSEKAPTDYENHYSPKYRRCYVEQQTNDARGINRALWDAFENHVLASIFFHHVDSPTENTCRIYNADHEIRDCDVTRKFIDDHMSN